MRPMGRSASHPLQTPCRIPLSYLRFIIDRYFCGDATGVSGSRPECDGARVPILSASQVAVLFGVRCEQAGPRAAPYPLYLCVFVRERE